MAGKHKSAGDTLKLLRNRFLSGLLILTPLVAAILILYWIFSRLDNIVQPLIELVAGQRIPGLGFVIIIVLIYIVGIVAKNYVGRHVVQFFEKIISNIPAIRQIYTGAKEVIEMLSGTGLNKAAFREVVLVQFPRPGMSTMAFITNETTDSSGHKLYAIFIPTPPIPTGGYFEIVPEDRLTHTRISVDQGFKSVISCGIILPDDEEFMGNLKASLAPTRTPPR
jgi:uncharacterized membrane protein